ncbi:MAG: bifunctional 4-hydroxy-2-oxoglutarate aldolase/2-dehydro-3-deoxy-phosphogluconate aldolase [Kiritimatiellae bacterium]|nr:bifunctional 4-hydroxy-2-oxoglutarate aldolase/2-dehydro-3-deoxy-phosphogluconate aldolase [Kiritimatiellia bacterium]
MNAIDELKKTRLMVLARGVPKKVLVKGVAAIADAGVTVFESTFDHRRKDCIAENAEKIAALVAALGDRMSIGAGTVLSVEEVRAAHEAGATFVVSPDTDPDVVAETRRLGMVSIPGAMTPSEIKRAYSLGADIVKLFPADDLGYHYIQNLKGPMPHIPLMATGGVNPETIPEFLSRGIMAVGTGITIFRPDLVAAEDYEGIKALAKEHVAAIRTLNHENH